MRKFQIKIFLEPNEAFELDALIPVFHTWIRESKLSEFVIDVGDYGHVKNGPGVVLIGHGSDYYLDAGEGRYGLLYSRKRSLEADDEGSLVDAVKRTLEAAALLEGDATLPKLRFSLGEISVRVNDRLGAPNDATTFATLSPVITKVLTKALGKAPKVEQIGSERELFTVRVTGGEGSIADAKTRLG
jgi:hypothetical protein